MASIKDLIRKQILQVMTQIKLSQLALALGLEDDVPGGYFLLLYSALKEAFEHQVRLVRFGSGAYDVKRRLGFHLEDTNHAMVSMAGITTRAVKKLVAPE